MTEEKKRYSKERNMTGTSFGNGFYCCFTAWPEKHPEGWKPQYNPEEMKYLVYQLELSPETKRPHFQGYVEFKKSTRGERARTLLGIVEKGWHAEKRKANNGWVAAQYCKKLESRLTPPEEFGTPPREEHKGRGHRSDLEEVAEAVEKKATLKDIAEQFPAVFIRHYKGIERLIKIRKEIKMPDPGIVLRPWQQELIANIDRGYVHRRIYWIWSRASSTGKTTTKNYLCFKYGIEKVLDGHFKWDDLLHVYDGHEIVIFNIPRDQEIHATHISVLEKSSDLSLHTSSKYEGGQKLWKAITIVFANIPPPTKSDGTSRWPDRIIETCLDPPEADTRDNE